MNSRRKIHPTIKLPSMPTAFKENNASGFIIKKNKMVDLYQSGASPKNSFLIVFIINIIFFISNNAF